MHNYIHTVASCLIFKDKIFVHASKTTKYIKKFFKSSKVLGYSYDNI